MFRERDVAWLFASLAAAATVVFGCSTSVRASDKATCPVILEYDHKEDHWSLVKNKCGARLELDFKGIPTVYTKEGVVVTLRVVDTNPLLFGLGDFDVKQADIEGLAKLQDLASAIGAALVGQVGILGEHHIEAYVPGEAQSRTTVLRDEADYVGCLLGALQAERYKALALVQQVAFENPSAQWNPSVAQCTDPVDKTTSQPIVSATYFSALDDLARAFAAVKNDSQGCSTATPALLAALTAPRATPAEVKALKAKLQDVTAKASTESCRPELKKFLLEGAASLASDIRRYDEQVAKAKSDPDKAKALAELQKSLDAQAEEGLPTLLALQGSGAAEDKALGAAAELLAKRDDVIDPLAAVADVDRRLGVNRADLKQGAPFLVSSAKVLAWTPTPQEQRWDKTETYSFKIKKNSPLAAKIQSPMHAEVTKSFVTSPRTGSLLGVGIGVTYTPIAAPKWALVANPSNATQKVVTKTDEDTRAGKLAVFGFYRFLQHACPSLRNAPVKPGLEFGAGLDPDNAAFFVGIGAEFAKYLRIGVGRTIQKIKVPRSRSEGEIVPATVTDLPLKSANEEDWYASLTFAFDQLTFFKKN
jgi:hypothetical protein